MRISRFWDDKQSLQRVRGCEIVTANPPVINRVCKQALALPLTLPTHTAQYQCSPQTILTNTDVTDVLRSHAQLLTVFNFHPTGRRMVSPRMLKYS
ncbi:hypothetical protein J6590_043976 [Homalodisca vitripennis]|nr:hypothetical protein J6590_043976 [Homalodisca vitripennis]